MEPDPRLVAAMTDAVGIARHGDQWPHDEHCAHEAAAILPAFLADPRTEKWLAERCGVVFAWKQQPAPDGTFEAGDEPTSYWRDRAEAILGRQP
jgi:hypothetical protein